MAEYSIRSLEQGIQCMIILKFWTKTRTETEKTRTKTKKTGTKTEKKT